MYLFINIYVDIDVYTRILQETSSFASDHRMDKPKSKLWSDTTGTLCIHLPCFMSGIAFRCCQYFLRGGSRISRCSKAL